MWRYSLEESMKKDLSCKLGFVSSLSLFMCLNPDYLSLLS